MLHIFVLISNYSIYYFFPFLISLAASDYYQFNDLLSLEEQALRKKVLDVMEKEVAPIMAEVTSCSLLL